MTTPDAVNDPIVALAQEQDAEELVEVSAWGDVPIVTSFAEPQAEYAALRKACGLMARGDLGVVEATGRDALPFLNNLLTNGLISKETKAAMPVGSGCHSFFLNLRGRVVADPLVVRVEEERILMLVSRPLAGVLVKALDLYRFAEKVRLRDASDEWYVLSLVGPTCGGILAEAGDTTPAFEARPSDFPATSYVAACPVRFAGAEGYAVSDVDFAGVGARHLIVPRDRASAIWEDLTTRFGDTLDDRRFGQRRLRPAGWAMFNAVRIEAGLPLLGIDFAPAPPSKPGRRPEGEEPPETKGGALPAETGPLFEQTVSVVSGCYLGQEVVARMHARQVQAKKIVGLKMDEDALPAAGAPVEVDDAVVGSVTSSTLSPVPSAAAIALATLKRPHFEIGTTVRVPAEGRWATARVVTLPFVEAHE